ncbi:TIGR04325 family methyltransferase [Sulfurovum riftiae]|uniref:Methyltransferase, TIGR04325 family n=1 Tax=Sulfurovum riftiae TaxID=1630136 RepID=A0A151CHA2_9BACT|nr:TIGR04325 family methyltransferase [Sulfurovum riftiae]KYJ86925.1 hypothetical protein AS592_08905 [Sulfurovum riftiae]
MKTLIKQLTPPILMDAFNKFRNHKYGWKGNYGTWQQAKKDSNGYDADEILQTVKNALLKVKKGEAAYERDGVIFDAVQYSWPLLSGLMFCAAKMEGELAVLDLGGSLGSTYYQNKKFLDKLKNVTWNIVEQKHFVDTGKEEFEDDRLKFFYDVDECIIKERPDVLLLSSVLQYIEKPYELLEDILRNDFEYILIDRTPFSKKGNDEIKLQVVTPDIYEASYPCWFFNELEFIKYFEKQGYGLVEKFKGADGEDKEVVFKGFIMERKC